MKRYKRLLAVFLVVCFVFCSSSSFVASAVDDTGKPLTVDINGKEYTVLPKNPNAPVLMADYDESDIIWASVRVLNNSNGEIFYFEDPSKTLDFSSIAIGSKLSFSFIFEFPKAFSRGEILDSRFYLFTQGIEKVVSDSAKLFFYDSNGKTHTKQLLTVEYKNLQSHYLYANNVTLNQSTSSVELSFDVITRLESFSLRLQEVSFNTVSQNGMLSSILDYLKNMWQSIKEIPEKISSSITNLGNTIGGFFDKMTNSVKGFFTELGDKIGGYFTRLWNQIYWGNAEGEAEYQPPDISTKFEDVTKSLNEWLEKLKGFSDSIESEGDEVAGYIKNGSNFIDRVLDVAPAPVMVFLSFAVIFVVVRKVVGR